MRTRGKRCEFKEREGEPPPPPLFDCFFNSPADCCRASVISPLFVSGWYFFGKHEMSFLDLGHGRRFGNPKNLVGVILLVQRRGRTVGLPMRKQWPACYVRRGISALLMEAAAQEQDRAVPVKSSTHGVRGRASTLRTALCLPGVLC